MFRIFLSFFVLLIFCLLSVSCAHQNGVPNFIWPLEPQLPISRGFSIYHHGIDFPKKTGHPILSAENGRVMYTGSRFSGYGKMIWIKHNSSWSTLYAHLHQIDIKKGDWVTRGEKIGQVGNTGRSSGPHLHFELLYNKQPVDPDRFITVIKK